MTTGTGDRPGRKDLATRGCRSIKRGLLGEAGPEGQLIKRRHGELWRNEVRGAVKFTEFGGDRELRKVVATWINKRVLLTHLWTDDVINYSFDDVIYVGSCCQQQ